LSALGCFKGFAFPPTKPKKKKTLIFHSKDFKQITKPKASFSQSTRNTRRFSQIENRINKT